MISKEQEHFVRNYISTEYFDPDKVISYLKIHDKVGDEIFDLSLKAQNKRNIRLVGDRIGFDIIDTEVFIRRVPFYFLHKSVKNGQLKKRASYGRIDISTIGGIFYAQRISTHTEL